MAIQEYHNDEITTAIASEEEKNNENILRPTSFEKYIGQSSIKENLSIAIEAAKKRKHPLDHILLYGPPGLGKTTLAQIIAKEMGVNIKITSGPALEKTGDLASILSNLEENDILFIDEIHRLKTVVEEILYSAMEDFALDIMIGQGPTARSMRIDLPKFTIIGATTLASSLTSPLRSRFGNVFKLEFYNNEEIANIISNNTKLLDMTIDEEAIMEIAKRSRYTPRIANRLLKRVRDYGEVKHNGKITQKISKEALELLNIDTKGLDHNDRLILKTIIDKFNGGPVGLNNLASTIGEDIDTLENVYEPYLLQIGFLKRTPKGRMVTNEGAHHIGLSLNQSHQISIN